MASKHAVRHILFNTLPPHVYHTGDNFLMYLGDKIQLYFSVHTGCGALGLQLKLYRGKDAPVFPSKCRAGERGGKRMRGKAITNLCILFRAKWTRRSSVT